MEQLIQILKIHIPVPQTSHLTLRDTLHRLKGTDKRTAESVCEESLGMFLLKPREFQTFIGDSGALITVRVPKHQGYYPASKAGSGGLS